MTASTHRPRAYTISDLQHLMRNVGDRADSWDDVILSLQGKLESGSSLRKEASVELAADLETLQNQGQPFTTDYRAVWRELTGENVNGSAFQASDNAVHKDEHPYDIDGAASSSSRVLDLLHRLESKEYQQMTHDLERFGDRDWKHDR